MSMAAREFLIGLGAIPVTENAVKRGNNPRAVVTACRCVNVALFVSRGLRRDVSVHLVQGSPDRIRIITFPGKGLRRVSPDERSISFFLLKAQRAMQKLEQGGTVVLPSGISVRKSSIPELIDEWSGREVYLATRRTEPESIHMLNRFDCVFVYDATSQYIPHLTGVSRPVYSFSSPERFILEVNVAADRTL